MLHWLQFTAGLVLSANWPSRWFGRRRGLAALVVAAGLAYVIAVHLPWPIDSAERAPLVHLALHAGFLVAGAAVGAAWRDAGELARILLVVGAMGAMTVVSLAEISGAFAYASYPPDQEAVSGIVMLAGMGLFWVALAFADLPRRLSRRRHPAATITAAAVLALLIALGYVTSAKASLNWL